MSHLSFARTIALGIFAVAAPGWAQPPDLRPPASVGRDAAGADGRVPDFSGVWVFAHAEGDLPERAISALAAGSVPPVTLVIGQTAAALSISRDVKTRSYVAVFPLDGAEAMQDTPQGPMKSRARWNGAVLAIEGTRPLPGPFGTRQVRFQQQHRLDDEGRTMIVEVVLQTPGGPKTRTVTFRRRGEELRVSGEQTERGRGAE